MVIFKIFNTFLLFLSLIFFNIQLFKFVIFLKKKIIIDISKLLIPSIVNSVFLVAIFSFLKHIILNVLNIDTSNILILSKIYSLPLFLIMLGSIFLVISLQSISYLLIDKKIKYINKIKYTKQTSYSNEKNLPVPYFHLFNLSLHEALNYSVTSFLVMLLPLILIFKISLKILSVF